MGRRSFWFAVPLLLLNSVGSGAEQQRWATTGNVSAYRLEGGGDVTSPEGATLSVIAMSSQPQGFGGGIASLDAQANMQQRLRLTGVIEIRGGDGLAGVWIRADGPPGRQAFENSMEAPVRSVDGPTERSVEIDVPETATRILFGPLLNGGGRMTVSGLRLSSVPRSRVDEVKATEVVGAALAIVRDHALHADRIDWPSTQSALQARAEKAQSSFETDAIIRSLLARLEDRHSMLLGADAASRYASQGVPASEPRVSIDAAGAGYVLMPGFKGADAASGRAFASDIAMRISTLAVQTRCGWIIDLRENTGGNMWPMLSALSAFLGEGVVGSVVDARGQSTPWRIRTDDASRTDLSGVRIAVLTGARTASSGEAVATAFRARPQTRSFGAATAGLSTSNRTFDLPGARRLFLTSGRFVDRAGRIYGGPIVPDEVVSDSAVMDAALRWLGCRDS